MRFGFVTRAFAVSALAAASASVVPALAGDAPDAAPLRLCADPTDLPFSSDDPAKPGLYLEIGDALGMALGASSAEASGSLHTDLPEATLQTWLREIESARRIPGT